MTYVVMYENHTKWLKLGTWKKLSNALPIASAGWFGQGRAISFRMNQ